MTKAEVLREIGKPDSTEGKSKSVSSCHGKNSKHSAHCSKSKAQLSWIYFPTKGDEKTETIITFSGEEVSDITRTIQR